MASLSPVKAATTGNAVNDDTCSNICQLARCGDGIVQSGEECDDGNTADDDACITCVETRIAVMDCARRLACK